MSSKDFVQKAFREFYSSIREVPIPASISQREFAFFLFRERIMIRHKSFKNASVLKVFLSETAPSDVYYSCAYYENPEYEMDRKGWLGADLVFDIDADHIPTPCNKIHDEWFCKTCKFEGLGIPPDRCPVCGSQKIETKTWPCPLCLTSAKEETRKLIDILQSDFGFSSSELHVYFSGHRGFHVQIEAEKVKTLDAAARKEIADYVSAVGLTFRGGQREEEPNRKHSDALALSNLGWGKRVKEGLQRFIADATKEDLKNAGIRKGFDIILQNRDKLIARGIGEGMWQSVKGLSTRTWIKLAESVASVQSAKIDSVVTTDVHRLIRLTGTLHGKTGLKKMEFLPSELEGFDPFKDAVAFKSGSVNVFVFNAPEFRIGDRVYGPYRNQAIELPTAAAVLLLCKGRAEVLNE